MVMIVELNGILCASRTFGEYFQCLGCTDGLVVSPKISSSGDICPSQEIEVYHFK